MNINVGVLIEVSKILKKKTGYSLWGYVWRMLMLALAVLCFIGGLKLFSFTNKISDYKDYIATSSMTESVAGKIVSCEKTNKNNTYKSVIRYSVKGKDYDYAATAFATSRSDIGEEVTVKYNSSDPTDAGIEIPPEIILVKNLSLILSIALFVLAVVFILITILIIVRIINPKKKDTLPEPQNQMMNY